MVVDSDSDALKDARTRLDGAYKGVYVTDTDKAERFLQKHDADYVMINREIYRKLISPGEKQKS